MAFGDWNIKVAVNAMPQKVATAVSELGEKLMGAEYRPIAYLGSQVANGINNAVLCEQTIITGRDTKNAVIVIFNEKPNDMNLALVSIERIVESGGELGGIAVDIKENIPDDAKAVWVEAFDGFVGSKVEPFALIGTKVTKGTDYIFIAESTPVVPDGKTEVVLVTVNSLTKTVSFGDLLKNKHETSLGYSFTWLQ